MPFSAGSWQPSSPGVFPDSTFLCSLNSACLQLLNSLQTPFFGISATLGKLRASEPYSLMLVFAWCLTLTLQITPTKEVSALQQEWALTIYSLSNASKIKSRVLVLSLWIFYHSLSLSSSFPLEPSLLTHSLTPTPTSSLLGLPAQSWLSLPVLYIVFLEIKCFLNPSLYGSVIVC